jgi:phage terminase large subunit
MLLQTTATARIKKLRKRVRIVQGGTSSSKTFSILLILIAYCQKYPNNEVSIVSESIPHLKRGALKDFIKILASRNEFKHDSLNRSDLKYHFPNGSYIEFFSADQPDKLRGARRDILFINECNNVNFEAYQQLAIRTKKFIYLDYNPTQEFWVHTELKDDTDSDFIILTYKDNEALDKAIVKEIEKAKVKAKTSEYWRNWWSVYGLGQVGSLEGVIFTNWKTIDTIPKDAEYLGNGLDFGYSNDPTAIVDFYDWNGQIIWHERAYQKGLLNSQIANILSQNNLITIAESAEPKSIAEIKLHGLKIIPTEKGPDSIQFGINLIQQRDFLVTKDSLNLIKELRGYTWRTDKTGKSLNVPIDDFNHAIDAARYFYLWKFKPFKPRKAFGMS